MEKILEITEKDEIKGHIYKIINTKTNKIYVGQTRSHRLNKNKYRPFGYIGRFNDHISEAINNTKKKQCTILNNSIRKHGKDKFKVELITECSIDELNKLEIENIKKFNSLHPNGYNMTIGGKNPTKILVEKDLNNFKKRGRPFGYKHKSSTIELMKKRNKEIADNRKEPIDLSNLRDYYYKNKIKKLLEYPELLKKDIKEIITPVYKKDTGNIYNYKISYKKMTLSVWSKNTTLKEKYEILEKAVNMAKKELGNNCQDI